MKLKIGLVRFGVSLLVALTAPFIIAGALTLVPNLSGLSVSELIDLSFTSDEIIAFIAVSVAVLVLVLIGQLIAQPLVSRIDEDDREEGQVKWFNVSKGFGFVTRESGEDVFVHFRSIRGRGHRSLQEGQRVLFGVVESPKGLQAEDVSILRQQ